jgi:hypothetical protein
MHNINRYNKGPRKSLSKRKILDSPCICIPKQDCDNPNVVVLLSQNDGVHTYQIRYYIHKNEIYFVIIDNCNPENIQHIPITRSCINLYQPPNYNSCYPINSTGLDKCHHRECDVECDKCHNHRHKECDKCHPKECKDGKDGKDGRDGCNGKDGKDGKDGCDGKDGISWIFKCEYDKCESYTFNNVVHMSKKCQPGLYIYTHHHHSKPGTFDPIAWKLLIKDCVCDDCATNCENTNTCSESSDDNFNSDDDKKYKSCFKKNKNNTNENKNDDGTRLLEWVITKSYNSNTIVRSNGSIYISIKKVPRGTKITNETYWKLVCQYDESSKTDTNLNTNPNDNQKLCNNDDYTTTSDVDCLIDYYCTKGDSKLPDCSLNYDNIPISGTSNTINTTNTTNTTITTNSNDCEVGNMSSYLCSFFKVYHAILGKNIVCVPNITKKKIIYPIPFDRIIKCDHIYNTYNNHLILINPGFYKLTLHLVYNGTNCFKTKSYLLKPNDNINHTSENSFCKENIISGSEMNHLGSTKIKNYLHYTFPFKVNQAMSTLVVTYVRNIKLSKEYGIEEKDVTIFGNDKSWIMVEYID